VRAKDKRDFVSAMERVNGARATNIEQLGTARYRRRGGIGDREGEIAKGRGRKKANK